MGWALPDGRNTATDESQDPSSKTFCFGGKLLSSYSHTFCVLISNPLIYGLSKVVLIHLFTTKI